MLYQPKEEDIFIHLENTKSQQRLIFAAPLKLTEEEEKAIVNFRSYLKEKNVKPPFGYDND